MPRTTTVRIDRDRLKQVLDAILGDEDIAKEFRWRGAISWATTIRGDNLLLELRCEELAACVEDDNPWRADNKYVHSLLLNAVYQFLDSGKTVEEVAAFIEQKLAIRLQSFQIAFEVLGLKPGIEPIHLGESVIGMLGQLTKEAGLTINLEIIKGPDPATTVGVLVKVEAPETMKALEPAVQKAEEALDLLSTTTFRSRFNHGPLWEMRLGHRCWVWPEGRTETMTGLANHWMRGIDYEVVPSMVQATGNTRFQAPLDAWTKLAPGEMRDALERAYISIGAAIRRAPDPHASVARAWTAIESLFAPGQPKHAPRKLKHADVGRAAQAIANRFKIAVAAESGTTDPFELWQFYSLRNKILHGAIPWNWRMGDAQQRLFLLYLHIDHLAGFCIKQNITTKNEFQKRLMEPRVVAETRKWIESWMKSIQFRLDHAILKDVRRRWGEVREFYGSVLKACGPKPS